MFCMYFLPCFVVPHRARGKADDEREDETEFSLLIVLFCLFVF